MKKVYGYIRVSTVKQSSGASLDTQKESIAKYALDNKLQIIEWFEEKQTAAKQGRVLFKKMLQNLRRNKADGAIIFKIDRSSRNLREWEDLKDIAQKKEIHFANDAIDLRSNSGVLTGDFMAVIASNYVRNLVEDSRRGFYGRLKQGLYPLKAPLGYLNKGGGKVKELDPITSPLVKKMFEKYCYGDYSVEVLRKKMFELGLRSAGNRAYSKSSIYGVLNNSFYMGVITLQTTGETFVGTHEPLISKRLFEQVSQKLKGKQVRRRSKHDYMFRKLLHCSCSYTLVGERQKGRVYYRCHNKKCSETAIREDKAFWAIVKKIRSIDMSMLKKSEIKNLLDSLTGDDKTERLRHISSLKLSLDNIQSRARKLLDNQLDGLISDQLFAEKKLQLDNQQKEYEERLCALKKKNTENSKGVKLFLELADNLYIAYLGGNYQKKTLIAKNLFSNLTLKAGKLDISTSFPYNLFEDIPSVRYCAG